MSEINAKVRRILADQGRTQIWVLQRMNSINPSLNLNASKFSALVTGNRTMSGDELIAFCKAVEINPDVFLEESEAGV